MDNTIKPSIVPRIEHRRPFLTVEHIPDPLEGITKSVFIVNIRLQTGAIAQCDLERFNLLMDAGFSDQWFLHSNGQRHSYVRTVHKDAPGRTLTVGRLITGGRRGTRVRYNDGSPLNLRITNLNVGQGFSKGHEKAAVEAGNSDGSW